MIQAFALTSAPRKKLPPAVDDVSFEARAGHVTALLGAPGAGKTTVLRLMLELQRGRGATHFRGRPLHRIPHPAREVGTILGDVPGHPARTVRGQLRMLCAVVGVPARRADQVLEVVGLAALREERLGTLERGTNRRLGLACALLADPHTLVLDGAGDGLSAGETRWLHGLLRAHAAQGGTVLITSTDPEEAARAADHVVTLEQGRLVAAQDIAEFARTRLRPRITVRTPHAARLASLLTEEARAPRPPAEFEAVLENGNRLSVYGSTCADIGETAYRHGLVVHQLEAGPRDVDKVLPVTVARQAPEAAYPDAVAGAAAETAPPIAAEPPTSETVPRNRAVTELPRQAEPDHPAHPDPHATLPAADPGNALASTEADPDDGLPAGTAPSGGVAPGIPGAPHAGAAHAQDATPMPATPDGASEGHADAPQPKRPAGARARGASRELPPPISVRPAPRPRHALRYELRRASGIGTGFRTGAAVLLVSALTVVLLVRFGHAPQHRLLTAWPRQLPLPPAALGAGLLGALAFGDEFRHPALAAERRAVPRRLGLLAAKLVVSGATALLLAFLTVGCDAEVLYLVYGPELAKVPTDWLSMGASWIGLVVGCAWAGVLAAGVFRSTSAGLVAVLAVPAIAVPLVPLAQRAWEGPTVRAAAEPVLRVREVLLSQWPFGGERYLSAVARVLAQPVGGALSLSLMALLCAYLLTTLRSRVR